MGCTAYDFSGCNDCGNNIVDVGETCDGTDLNDTVCTALALGFDGGTLACDGSSSCTAYDTSGCWTCDDDVCDSGIGENNANCSDDCPICGNNTVEGTGPQAETCDGTDLNDNDCFDFGYTGGTLACSGGSSCTAYDFSGCTGG